MNGIRSGADDGEVVGKGKDGGGGEAALGFGDEVMGDQAVEEGA